MRGILNCSFLLVCLLLAKVKGISIGTLETRPVEPVMEPRSWKEITPLPPQPFGECSADSCTQRGYCICYDTCIAESDSSKIGKWIRESCDPGMFWNPFKGPHGGFCDFWENLDSETQTVYRDDPKCFGTHPLPCQWREDPKCPNKYFFLPPLNKNLLDEVYMTCPAGGNGIQSFWNQNKKKCGTTCPFEISRCMACPEE